MGKLRSVQKVCEIGVEKMCRKNMWQKCVENVWGKHVGKSVRKTCGVEGTSHQSDILHSLIFQQSAVK